MSMTSTNVSQTSMNVTRDSEVFKITPASVTLTVSSGVLILAINAFQIYLLKKKFRREVNPLFIIIKHLCVADILNGGFILVLCTLYFLQNSLSRDHFYALHVMLLVCHGCGRYFFAVSTITLDALTVLKMIRVTQNKWYAKSTTRKMCYCIWFSLLIIFSTHEGIIQTIMKYSRSKTFISGSVLTFLSIPLQFTCFGRIFFTIRSSTKRNPHQRSRSSGNFLRIAISQVIAFVLCSLPEAIFHLLLILKPDVPKQPFVVIFGLLTRFNSLVDPVVFLVVYKDKLRTKRENYQVRFNGTSAFVVRRSQIKPRSICN